MPAYLIPDSPFARTIGFTGDRFGGRLWLDDDFVVIELIVSLQPGRGHLSALFDRILAQGYGIKVIQALPRMRRILENKGFRRTVDEPRDGDGPTAVWVRFPEGDGMRRMTDCAIHDGAGYRREVPA